MVVSVPSSLAYQCPSRGHRVKGASGVVHDRFATLDSLAARQGFSADEEDEGEVGAAPVEAETTKGT